MSVFLQNVLPLMIRLLILLIKTLIINSLKFITMESPKKTKLWSAIISAIVAALTSLASALF